MSHSGVVGDGVRPARVSPSWLALREAADAAARAGALVDELLRDLPTERPLVVHDFACGTGSMLRWLAPQLPGPQHWVCFDWDADLLRSVATADRPRSADGSTVTMEIRQQDVTRLSAVDCAPADLITVSALLDLLTVEELDRLVATCVDAHCSTLLTLSVTGRVSIWPPNPFDDAVAEAFNAHQRRRAGGRELLGPDAANIAVHAFAEHGYRVLAMPSPWRLGAGERALSTTWFAGWIAAACEHNPELITPLDGYVRHRLRDAADGRLRVMVDHLDLLVRPPG